jgi:hypothetical protein
MGQILALIRTATVAGKISDEDGGILEVEAPRQFVVGKVPVVDMAEPVPEDAAAVSAIKYNAHGNAWLRRPHFEVLYSGTKVKTIIPEDDVKELTVDMADKKKKRKETEADLVPDLSAVEESTEE